VVRASRGLGFCRPADVRWARLSLFRGEHESQWEILDPLAWKPALGGQGRTRQPLVCSCGRELPTLERFLFTYADGRQEAYILAQCSRCHTVFWEDA
jgi:hypothetical protein